MHGDYTRNNANRGLGLCRKEWGNLRGRARTMWRGRQLPRRCLPSGI